MKKLMNLEENANLGDLLHLRLFEATGLTLALLPKSFKLGSKRRRHLLR